MNVGVVEVGPAAVAGPHAAPPDLVCAAIEYIDDELGLLDERPVPVREMWDGLMRAVLGREHDGVVVVCPTWWPSARIDLVRCATKEVAADVEVRSRGRLLIGNAPQGGSVVVEIAAELVVVVGRASLTVVAIQGPAEAVAAKVISGVGTPTAVLIDAPAGVAGAASLGEAVAEGLRGRGTAVSWAAENAARRAAAASIAAQSATADHPPVAHRFRRAAGLAGVAVTVAVCGGLATQTGAEEPAATSLLVEGRVGVMVPTSWPVRRITTGPGSARLQVSSPSNDSVALLLTQSASTAQVDLPTTAQSLQGALADAPDDVFVGFKPSDVRVGRPVVTYREVRPDRHVAWIVLVDGSVRIAIGCQSPPMREDLIRDVCDRAVGTAQAVR